MPALLAYYGDKLKPKDKSPLTFMKAHFGIADDPLVKAVDKKDTHTLSMFGPNDSVQYQVRSDGRGQRYHHTIKQEDEQSGEDVGDGESSKDGRITEKTGLFDGETITDAKGLPYRVHYQRKSLIIAHPIINGKAQVNRDTAIRFWVDAARIPAGENDRTDPVYRANEFIKSPSGAAGFVGSTPDAGELAPMVSQQSDSTIAQPAPEGNVVKKFGAREESDQDRSWREWEENYAKVSGAADLTTLDTKSIERALGYGESFVQREKRKGWDGGAVNFDLIRSIEVDLYAFKSELKARGLYKSFPLILFTKGGKPGAPGLYERAITGKDGIKRIHWMKLPGGTKTAHNDAQAELFNPDGTPYQSLETRRGTTDKQRHVGMDALAALKRRVNLLRDNRGSAATLLGARLYAGFVASGGNQLTGQKITSPADLAALAQVYRDPRFETFRCIYLKDNEVVGETAYSSRLPGAVLMPEDYKRLIKNDKQRFGANGYYILHNHPSGESRPSKADEQLTVDLNAAVSGMRAHVIIDHNEYSVIEKGGAVRTHQAPELSGTDYHATPSIDHPLLGTKLGSPKDVALAAKTLQQELKAGAPVLIMTKGYHSEVDLIASAPLSLMMQKTSRVKAWLRGTGRAAGASAYAFLVVSNSDYQSHYAALSSLIEDGIVTDVVSESGMSTREKRPLMIINDDVFRPRKAGRKVAEPQWLEDDLVAQERYLTDGAKALGYATIDDMAVADYSAFERLAMDWRAEHQIEDALYQPASGYNQDGKKP
jgi:hypothetical protein